MARVEWWRTIDGMDPPQVLVGTLVLDDSGKLSIETTVEGKDTDMTRVVATLLRGVDRQDKAAVLAAMEMAPYRFNGAYVRAGFSE